MTEEQKALREAVARAIEATIRHSVEPDVRANQMTPDELAMLADAAIAVALERAAQVAETYGRVVRQYSDGSTLVDTQGGKEIAAAIRALIPASSAGPSQGGE